MLSYHTVFGGSKLYLLPAVYQSAPEHGFSICGQCCHHKGCIKLSVMRVVLIYRYTEILTWALLSRAENFTALRQQDDGASAVGIGNPATAEFEVCRTSLLPGVYRPNALVCVHIHAADPALELIQCLDCWLWW